MTRTASGILVTMLLAGAGMQRSGAAVGPSRFAITEKRLAQVLADVRDGQGPVIVDVLTMRAEPGD